MAHYRILYIKRIFYIRKGVEDFLMQRNKVDKSTQIPYNKVDKSMITKGGNNFEDRNDVLDKV